MLTIEILTAAVFFVTCQ